MNWARTPPTWRLPEGVDGALWQYAHTPRLAAEEDAYFAGHPLFAADAETIHAWFREPGNLVDLGCGTGRHAVAFARRGFAVTAVDLSHDMLQATGSKAYEWGCRVDLVRANLCRLDCFPDQRFDYAISMFSTLGMIRGAGARERALREAARILRPGGRIALHAHNIWLNLGDPQGRRWLAGHLARAFTLRGELGDRAMTYRGIPGMSVHLFRWGELRRLFRRAGLRIDQVLPIDRTTAQPIPRPWLWPAVRAGGWLVLATRV